MRCWKFAVTFENPESQAPQTVRGEIAAGSAHHALSLAYREAARKCPRRHWEDVVVLLEKVDAAAQEAPAAA